MKTVEDFEQALEEIEKDDGGGVPPPGTLVVEALEALAHHRAFLLIASSDDVRVARILVLLARRRAEEVLACPGCQGASTCPKHGQVGVWWEWVNEVGARRVEEGA